MNHLSRHLAAVAVQDPLDRALDAVPQVAIRAVGEDADRQHAPRATDPVDRDRTAGIVDVGDVVEEPHAVADEEPGDDPDQ